MAVAARDARKAEEFKTKHHFQRFYSDYEHLAKDTDVDIIYVSSLHPQHFELSKMFLENKKHVLCEKPMTTKLIHTRQLVEIAEKNGLFLMEGFWSRFFPAYVKLKEIIDKGIIGESSPSMKIHVSLKSGQFFQGLKIPLIV